MSGEDWDTVIKTNLDGFYNVLNPLIMPMVRRRAPGRIVTLASVSGMIGNRGQVNYSAAKAGIIGATKALALELAKREITVNCVAPGLIETEMIGDAPLEEITQADSRAAHRQTGGGCRRSEFSPERRCRVHHSPGDFRQRRAWHEPAGRRHRHGWHQSLSATIGPACGRAWGAIAMPSPGCRNGQAMTDSIRCSARRRPISHCPSATPRRQPGAWAGSL